MVGWTMRRLIIPCVTTYLKRGKSAVWKQAIWDRVISTHFYGLEPPDSDLVTKTIFGSRISVNPSDILGRYVYYFGVWEPNLTSWIAQRLAPGDVFIDIGANIGYYVLLASRLVGDSGKSVAIEALPAIFSQLQRNLRINKVENVRAVNCAAWDKEEMITMYTHTDDSPVTTTAMPGWASEWHLERKCQVPAAPVSTILEPDEIKVARLIKIDVEGAEWHVLSGMRSMMAQCRDDLEIIVEVTPQMLQTEGKSFQDVLDYFGNWNFYPYWIDNSATAYVARSAARPRRVLSQEADVIFHRLPTEQADIIFSRINAESL
jgi:FkbM family methyltransferase